LTFHEFGYKILHDEAASKPCALTRSQSVLGQALITGKGVDSVKWLFSGTVIWRVKISAKNQP
jgi:hypothetical protein